MASNSLAMLKPPFDVNLGNSLWCMLDANIDLAGQFLEYIKLSVIAMVHVLGLVEDKCCFSSLTFLKDKLCNHLANGHPSIIMDIFNQHLIFKQSYVYDC
jgi:hypothetical protein